MTKDFVAEFLMLVDSTSDGIETSYNAAGVLAHMASDGAEGKNSERPKPLFWFRPNTKTETVIGRYFRPIPKPIPKP